MDKNQQGIQYMQEGNYEEAAKIFNEAIEENPSEPVGIHKLWKCVNGSG